MKKFVGLIVALLVFSAIVFGFNLHSTMQSYTPSGNDRTVKDSWVAQICIYQAQAYDTYAYISFYDEERNLTQPHTFHVESRQVQLQGDIIKLHWPLSLVATSNGYKLVQVKGLSSSNPAQTSTIFNSEDWLFTTALNLPMFSWLVNASADSHTLSIEPTVKPKTATLYILSATENGSTLKNVATLNDGLSGPSSCEKLWK